jgi:hypothetical protein
MANKGTISAVAFKSEWQGPKGTLYYHDVTIDGKKYNIGAQEKLPNFLKVGETIWYEVTDEAKGKIKRVKAPDFQPSQGGGKQPYNNRGQAIGNALTNATLLVCHGKVDIKDLGKTAERILEIAENLSNPTE